MRCRPLLPILLSVLAVLAWIGAPVAASVHAMVVEHEVCEHGDIVEPVADAGHDDAEDHEEDHDHGCFFDGLASSAAVSELPTPVGDVAAAIAPSPRLADGAPRGPPLRYAPKTSPPHVA